MQKFSIFFIYLFFHIQTVKNGLNTHTKNLVSMTTLEDAILLYTITNVERLPERLRGRPRPSHAVFRHRKSQKKSWLILSMPRDFGRFSIPQLAYLLVLTSSLRSGQVGVLRNGLCLKTYWNVTYYNNTASVPTKRRMSDSEERHHVS